jgi:hypothetical protein
VPLETIRYRRDELYDQIWKRPMREVAKDYGVTDVALRKTCRKLDVPLPPQGHWNKPADRRGEAPPLPKLKPGQPEELVRERFRYPVAAEPSPEQKQLEDEWLALLETRADMQVRNIAAPFELKVSATGPLHKLASQAKRELLASDADRQGFRRSIVLPVQVAEGQVDRVGRILSSLFLGMEKAGHEVIPRVAVTDY